MSVRVKICGVTNLVDALLCVEAGADAIGFNFWPGSKRYLEPAEAGTIARALPPTLWKVGVFVNAERAAIERAVGSADLDAVQLHGDETPASCRGFPVKVIKALRVGEGGESMVEIARGYAVDYFLLDADAGSDYGGGGKSFDWQRAAGMPPERLFLAGGLRPENVAEAVRRVRPFAVDTASGVESRPGKKDPLKVKEFIRNAKHA
jgi:phosphoribosylanthranilate isomerase